MSKPDDGGPVVPSAGYDPPTGPGLRDYFAAAALTGLLAWSPPNADSDTSDAVCGNTPPHQAAEWAYQYADAMLRARAAG